MDKLYDISTIKQLYSFIGCLKRKGTDVKKKKLHRGESENDIMNESEEPS